MTQTATPAPTVTPHADLWDEYRRLRGALNPDDAATAALNTLQYAGPIREVRAKALMDFEERCSLSVSVEDFEARTLAESMGVEPEPEIDPIAAIESDAQTRVGELRDQRQRLAPEALVDDRARQELLDVESQLREAERAAELAPLARAETARRARAAIETDERERQQAALAWAKKLAPQRAKAAAALDAAATVYAECVSAYRDVVREHASAVAGSGVGPAGARRCAYKEGESVKAGLRRALHDAGLAPDFEALGRFSQRDQPVVASEPNYNEG
ncbi:MAG: hypothetical protein WAU69_03060 [Solirubrobacteraceae bacterium]